MKELHRTVRTAVVIYDCSRLLFLLILLSAFMGPGPAGQFRSTGLNLPFMMYAAPQALFPLMSFFLLIRLEISKAYIPLYISGKGFCILCLALWLAAAFGPAGGISRSVLWTFFMAAADLGTILGMVVLQPGRGTTGRDGVPDNGTSAPVFAETPEGK